MSRTTRRLKLIPENVCGDACAGDRIYKKKGISQVPPLRPIINGLMVVGNDVPSGTSNEDPNGKGYRISLDPNNDTFTYQELWNRTLDNFVHKDSGQKILTPSFEGFSSRCFIRGRSTGGQAAGQNTVVNGLIEIDPETGDYLTQPFDLPGGGAFEDNFEIGNDERLYLEQTDGGGIWVYDMDFNQLDLYDGAVGTSNSTDFGIDHLMNVAMAGITGTNVVQYYSKDKSVDFSITYDELTPEPLTINMIRCTSTHLLMLDGVNDNLYYYNIENREVDWMVTSGIGDTNSLSFDYNGDIIIGRAPGTSGVVEKLSSVDGSKIWSTNVTQSLGVNASITQVGNITGDYIFAWAGVSGVFFLLKDEGTPLDNTINAGRGNIGIHPFTGERIVNFKNQN